MLKGKQIVLGISGGIAAYKCCYLVRELIKCQATVQVIMTRSAREFITALTLETLSGKPVIKDMFSDKGPVGTHHIEIAQNCDLMIIAPATYNIIGKAANGIADDFLSTAIAATNCPIFFAPAMNTFMFKNPILQQNIAKLKKHHHFIMPGTGELACGYSGEGRMAEPERIVQTIEAFLNPDPLWTGKTVLITAGPTREKIDPVRYISNFSSGKMGYALAEAAKQLGAAVTLVSGPVNLSCPDGINRIEVKTTSEMNRIVLDQLSEIDVLIKSAAVVDYSPKFYTDKKIKKKQAEMTIELKKTPDILANVRSTKKDRTIVVGFSLETDDEIENARSKLIDKDLDLIVINNPNVPGAGFQVDTNIVTFLDRDNRIESLQLMTKPKVAREILRRIERFFSEKKTIASVA